MPRSPAKGDLHGNAPDECRVALLVIDMINAFDFEGASAVPNCCTPGRTTTSC